MVSARYNEVADETLVPVDYKIASKFFWFFVMFYEIGRGHGTQVTSD
jgi:hypothetical protein